MDRRPHELTLGRGHRAACRLSNHGGISKDIELRPCKLTRASSGLSRARQVHPASSRRSAADAAVPCEGRRKRFSAVPDDHTTASCGVRSTRSPAATYMQRQRTAAGLGRASWGVARGSVCIMPSCIFRFSLYTGNRILLVWAWPFSQFIRSSPCKPGPRRFGNKQCYVRIVPFLLCLLPILKATHLYPFL